MSNPKTPEAMYEELVAKIVEAVPEIVDDHYTINSEMTHCPHCGDKTDEGEIGKCRRPITLEDALLALGICDKCLIAVTLLGQFVFIEKDNLATRLANCRWQLGKPLSEQSPETISFLHFLLVHES